MTTVRVDRRSGQQPHEGSIDMPQTGRTRSAVRRIGISAVAVVLVAGLVFVAWANTTRPADPEPLAQAETDPELEVTLGSVIELSPIDREPRRGVVFYPGARVAPEAYVATWAPIAAETDTLVLIPQMPLNLAVFGRSRADQLIRERAGIDEWWVGGHSLGGAMAASWLGGQPEGRVEGLVLWASFSTGGAELQERSDVQVLSVSGSRDGLATPDDINDRRSTLPPEAVMIEIDGMNHAQFGRYGDQRGDLPASVDDGEAQRQLTAAHAQFWDDTDPDATETP
jgi:hypothetical protein